MRKKQTMLPDRLLELRGSTSQSSFAKSLGILQQTYARWEIGDRQPKLQDLVSLATHFGVTTDWLLGLTPNCEKKINQPQNSFKLKLETLKSDAESIAAIASELLKRITKIESEL